MKHRRLLNCLNVFSFIFVSTFSLLLFFLPLLNAETKKIKLLNSGRNTQKLRNGVAGVGLNIMQTGIATVYTNNGLGNCSYTNAIPGIYNIAINTDQYAGSRMCGAFIDIWGPGGSIRARVVNSCPTCSGPGHLDIEGDDAMQKITNGARKVAISWMMIKYDPGSIQIKIKEGSNNWWAAFQVMNHSIPIKDLEYKKNGQWIDISRKPFNYFVVNNGVGGGPVKLRITAINNKKIVANIPRVEEGKVYTINDQF
jgi:expansin